VGRKSYHRQPHLWRHPNGVFYLIWTEGGKPRRRSAKTRSRVDAERVLAVFVQVHDSASWGVNLDITLHKAAETWLAEKEKPRYRLSLGTLRPYRSIVERIKRFFPPQMRAADVSPRDIRKFLDFLEREFSLSPQGIRKRLGHVSMVFRFQAREGNLVRNPCDAVAAPTAKPIRTPAITEEDFLELLSDLSATGVEVDLRDWLRDLVTVLWFSGLRSIEAYRLNWEDIDLDGKLWTIRSPSQKGGTRVEPIHRKIISILVRLKERGKEGPFSSEWPLRNEWRRFKIGCVKWKGMSLHSLRHAFVTRLAKQGNPSITKYLAGHHTDSMSDHYTQLGPEDVRQALNRLN